MGFANTDCTDGSTSTTTVEVHIVAGSDDLRVTTSGEEVASQECAAGIGTVSSANVFESGLRFRNVDVPPAAVIVSAYLTITSSEDQAMMPTHTMLVAENGATPIEFGGGDFASRPRTTAAVLWRDMPPWVIGATYTSPDLGAVVQQIVDLPGWAAGNPLVLFWLNNATALPDHQRVGYSFESDPALTPTLVITYR